MDHAAYMRKWRESRRDEINRKARERYHADPIRSREASMKRAIRFDQMHPGRKAKTAREWHTKRPWKSFSNKLKYLSRHPEVSMFPSFLPIRNGYEGIDNLTPRTMLIMKEAYERA